MKINKVHIFLLGSTEVKQCREEDSDINIQINLSCGVIEI
uniref:Uncharacterized protein n=1 Tax=Setaria italica TaxID=4555 RepID=K4A4H1_SETIT